MQKCGATKVHCLKQRQYIAVSCLIDFLHRCNINEDEPARKHRGYSSTMAMMCPLEAVKGLQVLIMNLDYDNVLQSPSRNPVLEDEPNFTRPSQHHC